MLKMAPNSMFAILLRSSWWISIGIALLFILASRALLPEAYWVFGAMSGFPFLVIGGVVLWRQSQAPSPARVDAVQQAVGQLTWRAFADELEKAFARDGYSVQRIDGAADFALTREGRTTLVSARRWKAAQLGEDALVALHAAMTSRDASDGLCLSLGGLSGNAEHYARNHRIQRIDPVALARLLRDMKAPSTP